MFKICTIGCGGMSTSGHGPSAKLYAERYPDTELSACCDLDAEKAESYRAKFGYKRIYTDYMEMLEKEKPDVAMVIVPPALTEKISIDVINTGTNIILEKPPGLHDCQTRAIHEAAVANNVHARVAFNRRHMPLVLALIDEIKACGEEPMYADCQFVRMKRTDADFCTTAIHAIDSLRYILGSDYTEARFDYRDFDFTEERRGTDYHVRAICESGAVVNIGFITCSGGVAERIFVSCKNHAFFADLPVWNGLDAPGKLTCVKNGAVYKTVKGEFDTMFESSGFYTENESFFERIRSGAQPYSEVADGIQAVQIADCMRRREAVYRKDNI